MIHNISEFSRKSHLLRSEAAPTPGVSRVLAVRCLHPPLTYASYSPVDAVPRQLGTHAISANSRQTTTSAKPDCHPNRLSADQIQTHSAQIPTAHPSSSRPVISLAPFRTNFPVFSEQLISPFISSTITLAAHGGGGVLHRVACFRLIPGDGSGQEQRVSR